MGILLGAAIGIAIGAATLGASAASGTAVPGQTIALSHIPSTAHGYAVVERTFGEISMFNSYSMGWIRKFIPKEYNKYHKLGI